MKRLENLLQVRTFVVIALVVTLLMSCSNGGNGELIGAQGRQRVAPMIPFGMVYVPGGSFVLGAGGFDPTYQMLNMKTVSMSDFFMDETEITNNEYRQFVEWVKEYHIRKALAEAGIEGFAIESEDDEDDEVRINWNTKIKWTPEMEEAVEDLYLPVEERFAHRKELDVRKLNYEFWTFNYQAAARKVWDKQGNAPDEVDENEVYYGAFVNRPHCLESRRPFMRRHIVNVYPDTLCWIFDWSYSFNDPMVMGYWSSPLYDFYPVVGVNWIQAEAFCKWRSERYNSYTTSKGYPETQEFRLPTEAQWEYAARGGIAVSPYPWGGNYARNINGCLLGNFKPGRGDYAADGSLYPCIVAHYAPNDFGLYDMMGNVSEWCMDAYDESLANNLDFNPAFLYDAKPKDGIGLKRKVVRGGSFKDFADLCKVYYRAYEYQDSCKSYVGFRCVQPLLGNGMMTGGSGSNVY